MTHTCFSKFNIIGSGNGLLPGRRQTIIWTNAEIELIGPLGTNFNKILVEIYTFLFKKMPLKMSSGKWRPFCIGLNVLTSLQSRWYILGNCTLKYKQMIHEDKGGRQYVTNRTWLFIFKIGFCSHNPIKIIKAVQIEKYWCLLKCVFISYISYHYFLLFKQDLIQNSHVVQLIRNIYIYTHTYIYIYIYLHWRDVVPAFIRKD